jgi:putative ATPase
LFVDEVHRFNKAQQDAFLPYLETGDIVLFGATTENPSFELNAALLSRAKVYVLAPLGEDQLVKLLDRALADGERGLGTAGLTLEDGTVELIASLADGDARIAYTVLEVAAEAVGRTGRVTQALVREVVQRRRALYDKEGEEHYNLISALHKSVRNSDVDASLYWLARMLEGGADPRFLARRLLRVASEDVGLADPRALEQAAAAAHAVEHVGMPECDSPWPRRVYLAWRPSRTRSTGPMGGQAGGRRAARPGGAAADPQRPDPAHE